MDKHRFIGSHKGIALTSALVLAAVSSVAVADDTATGTVDAYVGLAEAFAVECEDVHFGVFRVDFDELSGEGTQTANLIPKADTLSAPGNVKGDIDDSVPLVGLALSTAHADPLVGVCKVIGAPGSETTGDVAFGSSGDGGAESATDALGINSSQYEFLGDGELENLGSDKELSVTLKIFDGEGNATGTDTTPGTFQIAADRNSIIGTDNGGFLIGGSVEFPDTLTVAELGAYAVTGFELQVDVSGSE